ncbi:hypothetical protein D3C87_2187530 [compost metagenome]
MIADSYASDPFANRLYDTPALVPQDNREDTFRIGARKGIRICMAHAARNNLYQHFACSGWSNVYFNDL